MSGGYEFLDELRSDLAGLPDHAKSAPRHRWRVAVPIALVALVAAAGVIVTRGGSTAVPTASAASFLNNAADRVLEGHGTTLGPHQFYYEKYYGTDLGPIAGGIGTSEQWTSRLGTGRLLYDGHQIGAFTGSTAHPAQTSFGNRVLTYAELQALPTDPAQLAGIVREASTPTGKIGLSSAEYRTIGQLLSGSPWPIKSDLRAGLLRVAATIPGLTIDRQARDCAGRPVTAIVNHERGYADDKPVRMRFELFFNPKNDLFLGQSGTVEGRTKPFQCIALLKAGVVNSMRAKP